MTVDDRMRPNPLRWIAYAYGAGLPARHRTWVLHDVTTRAWQLRHLARTTVQLLPIGIALFFLVPGPPHVRALGVLAGALLGYFYSTAYMVESAEHRVMKAGYPVGTAAATREERNSDVREEARERYERKWRR